jgi:hypothetical protein
LSLFLTGKTERGFLWVGGRVYLHPTALTERVKEYLGHLGIEKKGGAWVWGLSFNFCQ